jgi:cytochrome oxidase Cu insertion factor (SCO1/SenC/PrrC family)
MIAGRRRSRDCLAAASAVAILLSGGATPLIAPPVAAQGAAVPGIGGGFALTTTQGRAVTDASFRGKWLLIYFGYTACPDACPTALSAMAAALGALGPLAAKVQPLFITLDPKRDTPAVIDTYVKTFDPRILGLHGTAAETEAAARKFRVYYAVRQMRCASWAAATTRSTTAHSFTSSTPGAGSSSCSPATFPARRWRRRCKT